MREKLTELLAKVEGAAEGSQELDEAIHVTLRADDPWWKAIAEGRRLVAAGQDDVIITTCNSNLRADSWALSAKVASYSTSLDAAFALVSRVAPRHHQWAEALREATSALSDRYGWHCTFSRQDQLAKLPLAILGSLLKALLAQTETSDAR